MRRVLIIGSGGSGKTTLARRLGEVTGLPVIHLDTLYWKPGWVPTPAAEWRGIVNGLVADERWIMDGNYSGTFDARFHACDTIIFMDVPRWRCLWRVVKRRLRYGGRSRPDMSDGCPEQLTWEFVRWIWSYPRTRRPAILERLAAMGGRARVIVLRSTEESDRFLVDTARHTPVASSSPQI